MTLTVPQFDTGETKVTSSSDGNFRGTLRYALSAAREGDRIEFDPARFGINSHTTIYVEGDLLPPIDKDNIILSALPGSVILDGSNLDGEWMGGLQIVGAKGATISGLQIVNFTGPAIGISGNSQNNVIENNRLINNSEGVNISTATTSENTIRNNIIGIDRSNNPAGNSSRGISIMEGAHDNVIGPGNQIAFNGPQNGDLTGYGVFGYDRYNSSDGCGVFIEKTMGYPDSNGNWITRNSIHDNKGNGICIVDRETGLEGGPNEDIEAPYISTINVSTGFISGISCARCTVEIFSNSDGYEGQHYEGKALADSKGIYTFQKLDSFNRNVPFENTIITTTATDGHGNTSKFSRPGGTLPPTDWLQSGNRSHREFLLTKPSRLLVDSKIGLWLDSFKAYQDSSFVLQNGFKRIRIQTLQSDDQPDSTVINSETISPKVDYTISKYADNGVKIQYFFGGRESGVTINYQNYNTTFQTQREIDDLLEFVDFVTNHFKDRITHYEILNEPGYIDLPTYINVINQTVPVIRNNDDGATILVNMFATTWIDGNSYPGYEGFQRSCPTKEEDHETPADGDLHYEMANFLSYTPGILPSVDGISWHPFYDNIPNDPYYQDYPKIVDKTRDLAVQNGFHNDEYFADEIMWSIVDEENWNNGPPISQFLAAKYYLRAIVEHRALDLTVTFNPFFQMNYISPMAYLANIMAGAEPEKISFSISTNGNTNVRRYAFVLPTGEKMIALWTNDIGTDETLIIDEGMTAQLRFSNINLNRDMGYTPDNVTAIDVLHGYEQELMTIWDFSGNLTVGNLKIKDYPIILRFNRR